MRERLTAMSLTMTAHLRSCLFCRTCCSSVVFPISQVPSHIWSLPQVAIKNRVLTVQHVQASACALEAQVVIYLQRTRPFCDHIVPQLQGTKETAGTHGKTYLTYPNVTDYVAEVSGGIQVYCTCHLLQGSPKEESLGALGG